MATVENLILEFHNLQGNNWQEKHKSFRMFLNTLKQNLQNSDKESKFVAELKPLNKMEHSFRIDVLLHLKRHKEVLEILKSGNNQHIGRILKNYQFFAEAIPTVKPDALVNDLFPNMSYVTKSKVINRVYKTVKNEQLLDKYFLIIEERYGHKLAFALLPGCSVRLIKLKVEKYKPKLPGRQILYISKKDSGFPSFYFGLIKKDNDTFSISKEYPSVIKYFARKDIGLFWKLQKEFNFDFKSGKHLTKKLILQNEEVLKDGEKCLQWFQNKKLYNTISQNGKMEVFLLSFYNDTPAEFIEAHMKPSSDIYKILKYLTPDKRYNLIRDLFDKKYSKSILDYQMKFTKHFLESIPISIREPIVRKFLEESDDYVYLLNATEAILSIKTMMQNCSSAKERAEKLEKMCRVLEINRDEKEKITEVFEFVFERYRNDTKLIKSFIYQYWSNDENLKYLEEEQLKLLDQMELYVTPDYNHYCCGKIPRAYLQCLIKNNRNYDDYLMECLKRVSGDSYRYHVILLHKFQNMNIVLEKIIDFVERFKDNEHAYDSLTQGLIQHIYLYYTSHRKNLLPFARYKHIFEYVSKRASYVVTNLCTYLIKRNIDKDFYKLFWEHYEEHYEWYKLTWFAKNDIQQIEENIITILSSVPYGPQKSVYVTFAKYTNESLRKKIINYVESKISFDDSHSSAFLIHLLSYVDSEEFLRITAPFMPPPDGKFDLENTTNKVKVQQTIIRSLCNIESERLLDTVRKVCIGDYLKFGLQPLYKIAFNMKEIDVLPFLNDLKRSPVSLAKHSLLQSVQLLPTKDAIQFLERAYGKEKNHSVKGIIFKKSLAIFINSQTEVTWKQVRNYFHIINSDDTAMHDFLIQSIKKIPSTYIIDYVQSTYDVLKKTTRKEFVKKVTSLAQNIPKTIYNTVQFKFLEEIIEIIIKEMFLHTSYEDCYWDYVLHTNINRSKQLLSCAIEIMKTIVSNTNTGYAKVRLPLNHFTTSFCKKLLKEKKIEHKELLEIFDLQWSFFPKHCLFDTVLLLKITVAYYESGFDLNKFAFLLSKQLHKCVEKSDSDIISVFGDQLLTLCNLTDITDDSLYTLVDQLIRCNDHRYNYILSIYLLPKDTFPEECNRYHKWLSIIKAIEEYGRKGKDATSILFHYDKYLGQYRQEYIWIGNQRFPPVTTTKL